MNKSKISWTDVTWNPITGCTPVSEGCEHCYAKRMVETRLAHLPRYRDGFRVTIHQDRFDEPSRWRTPRRVFICSMGDLFHEDIPGADAQRVLEIAAKAKDHTFFVLTKRPARMRQFLNNWVMWTWAWPPANIWLGTTAENQGRAQERLPELIATTAEHRFVSLEPLLGPVDLGPWLGELGWVIVGGESGPEHRLMDEGWARSIRDQCAEARVPFHFKQHSGPRSGWNPVLDGTEHKGMPPFGEQRGGQ